MDEKGSVVLDLNGKVKEIGKNVKNSDTNSSAEIIDVKGISEDLSPRSQISVTVTNSQGATRDLAVLCRIDTGVELEYYKNGGILQYVLRGLLNN